MQSHIFRDSGETVTIVRISTDKEKETIIASEVVCIISPVQGKYESWQAILEEGNRDILKGDILKRPDGSELQVLRSATQSAPSIGEVTQLDLKDYNPEDQPLQAGEMDVLKELKLRDKRIENLETVLLFLISSRAGSAYDNQSAQEMLKDVLPASPREKWVEKIINKLGSGEEILGELAAICEKRLEPKGS